MKIGFIGFGKVALNLVGMIKSEDIEFITSFEDRSKETIDNIKKADVNVLDTFIDVAQDSDILISTTSPKSALSVAQKYGKHSTGVYLDLNNISPDTTFKINEYAENFVDGAIIGKIDSDNPTLFLSGSDADKLLFLDKFLDVKIISDKIGDASTLKLLRSTYTKSVSAILIESYGLALKHDLGDEFFDVLALTEGDDFKDKSLSRIINTQNNHKRKCEELEEILDYFGDDLEMVRAALKKFSQL